MTYPYGKFQREIKDPTYNWTWPMLDSSAYSASNPRPEPQTYREVILENEYLRLGILPDLGGRLYECFFKLTGHQVFYMNSVIKPSPWGPPGRDGLVAGWLPAGGLEWDLPAEEHGFAWGVPWGYDTIEDGSDETTVTVFLQEQSRLQISVDISLKTNQAAFTLRTRLTNPTDQPVDFKYWHNAMLAPGGKNRVGPDLQLVLPSNEVTLHSTGDDAMPTPGDAFSWPVHDGRDLSQLKNWRSYLGFFARPAANSDFMGVYDVDAEEGLARVFPSDVMRGAKFFGLGWADPIDSSVYSDDDSSYVEMHGGLAPTFDDKTRLEPDASIYWEETWFPVAGTGGFVYADQNGAFNLKPVSGGLQLLIYPIVNFSGSVGVSIAGEAILTQPVQLKTARPINLTVPLPENLPSQVSVAVQLLDADGQTQSQFEKEIVLP